jgi:hypothetical protein
MPFETFDWSAPRKRSVQQSSAIDAVIAGQVLRLAADPSSNKKYASGGYATVANVSEVSGFDIDVIPTNYSTSSSQVDIVGLAGYGTRAKQMHRATDVHSFGMWGTMSGVSKAGACLVCAPFGGSAEALTPSFSYRLLANTVIDAPSANTTSEILYDVQRNQELENQATYLNGLEANWNGYGAKPLEAEAVADVVDTLKEHLAGLNIPAPDLIPGGNGSIQAEWRRKGYEVFFYRGRSGEKELYVEEVVSGEQLHYEGSEALQMLRFWAEQIAD